MSRKATPKSPGPKHFIRQWRKSKHLTLEQLAERIGMTHQNLGKIERGQVPATDALLDAVAEALSTDAGSIKMRDPSKPDALWSLWDVAKTLSPKEQEQGAKLLTALKGTGTDG